MTRVPEILIVDDEEGIRKSLSLILEDEGYRVRVANEATTALRLAQAARFDVILCDVRMPGRSGLEILPEILECQPDTTVLMMSAYGDVNQALEAVRSGAYDYLAKPFSADELLLTIHKANEREALRSENRWLRCKLLEPRLARPLVASSDSMKQIHELIDGAAPYKTTVLITGESGVGKEVVARTLHARSSRSEQPFVALNCAAIPEALMESELFGHARGAFTGAESDKPGLFREAQDGTLFLDEIGELPRSVQVKLLRVLQEEEVQPVGEVRPVPVDVRIVTATARDLRVEVAANRFREDLYYRLNVFEICVPPLRERLEDLPVLVDELLQDTARRMGKQPPRYAQGLLDALVRYPWPGNVRELQNSLERALILCPADSLTPELFPFLFTDSSGAPDCSHASPSEIRDLSIKRQGRLLEERLIRAALEKTSGNRTRAAQILEISPRSLQYKLKEFAIDPLNPQSMGADS